MTLKYKWQMEICNVSANWLESAVSAANNPVVVVPENIKLFRSYVSKFSLIFYQCLILESMDMLFPKWELQPQPKV